MRYSRTGFRKRAHGRSCLGLVAAAVMFALPFTASAQSDCPAAKWPCHTIQVVSHAAPGGGTDTTIRMWLPAARKMVDQDIRVVYKQGGGAAAAQRYMKTRGPDGHTIMAFTQTHLYTIARNNSPVDINDIKGVARAMDDPSVIVVAPDSPIDNYKELVSKSKEKPLNWGVAQVGGTEHIGITRWADAAGVKARVVPFGSGGKMITALRSGAVDATLANVSEALSDIKEGQLKPIAVLYPHRVKDLPDVPSTYEYGAKVSVTTTRGYYVDARTDPAITKKIEHLLLKALHSKKFENYLRSSGLDPKTSIAGMDVWDKQIKEDYKTAEQALKKIGLTHNK